MAVPDFATALGWASALLATVSSLQLAVFGGCLALYVTWTLSLTLARGILLSAAVTLAVTALPALAARLAAGPSRELVDRAKQRLSAALAAIQG